jgi:hypothetical protein
MPDRQRNDQSIGRSSMCKEFGVKLNGDESQKDACSVRQRNLIKRIIREKNANQVVNP